MKLMVYLLTNVSIVLCMQVDLCAEEMGNNVRPAVALLGDINAIVTQVTQSVHELSCL